MMMTEAYEEMVYREGYRRGKAERHKMLDDGTLVVSVDDATAVTRVLVEDSEKNGDLYYADRPKGEWIPHKTESDGQVVLWECSKCGNVIFSEHEADRIEFHKWCGRCGADMRGEDE